MVYVDASGNTHVSLSEASKGYTANTTASRDAAGKIIGDSTGSKYVREQEAQKAAAAQETQKVYQQTIIPAQQQQATFTAQYQQKKEGFLSRSWGALKQGYSAGEGKGFSLLGLNAPTSKNTYTNSLFEKTQGFSKKYDAAQNSLFSFLPSGLGKDVVIGVTNIPQIAIETAGTLPYGTEAIIRNPSSISDSVSFGVGAMAGFTVQKAKTHPGELAGELIGGYGLAKGAGKIAPSIKETASITGSKINKAASVPSLKAFAKNERASFTPQLIYKEKTAATKPKIESYIVAGDKLVPEASMKINSIKLGNDVKLTPEMESVLFGKKAQHTGAIKEATVTDNFITSENKIPSESSIKIDSIKLGNDVKLTPEMESVLFGKKAQKETYFISSAKIGNDVKLTPEMESVLFRKSKSEKAFNPVLLDQKLNRNIFSPELTKPTKYKINNIVMEDSFSFPIAASLSPALAYNLPVTIQEQKQKTKPILDSIFKPINDPFTDSTFKPINDPFIDSTFKPIIDPFIDPVKPGPIDPFIDPVKPGPIDPFIDPIIINTKVILPAGGDFDFLGPINKPQKGKRKTKQKMSKNKYGDPFKIKL